MLAESISSFRMKTELSHHPQIEKSPSHSATPSQTPVS